MTPTHAVKNGKRYRYYVSRPLIVGTTSVVNAGLRIPAPAIEQIVTNRIRRLLSEPARVFELIEHQVAAPLRQQSLIARAADLAEEWVRMSPLRMRGIFLSLVKRIDVDPTNVTIELHQRQLVALLENPLTVTSSRPLDDEPTLRLSQAVQLRRAGKEVRMVIDHPHPFALPSKPDPSLLKAIGRAHRFHDMLVNHETARFADLALNEKLHRSYLSQVLRLAYLAPDITVAILEGRQPRDLTATALIEHPRLPLNWQEQRAVLGFVYNARRTSTVAAPTSAIGVSRSRTLPHRGTGCAVRPA
jgi:site-specific DNA recombinase